MKSSAVESNVGCTPALELMLKKLPFPAVTVCTASFVGLLQVYDVVGGHAWRLSSAALAYGFVMGFALQRVVREPIPRWRVALAAFAGSFLLWLPVVVVTYGFALMATPVFAASAGATVLGTVAGLRCRGTSLPPDAA